MKLKKELSVVELFAGVGGFRIGLCGTQEKPQTGYKVIWANQWEPATKTQHAAIVYRDKFHRGEEPNPYFNEDINKVVDLEELPIPKHDLLVGGFPCQDYSVARTLSQAAGIEGKKGVLWWAIHKIISRLGDKSPSYLMLENVDRLLKSPAKQRGRDFGIILASLSDLGYAVEWRVVNAAEYGMPQRRRRIFILGYKEGTTIYNSLLKTDPNKWLMENGTIAKAFPVMPSIENTIIETEINGPLSEVTNNFSFSFQNAGLIVKRKLKTIKTKANFTGEPATLGAILLPLDSVAKEFIIPKDDLKQWEFLKNGKKEMRKTKAGFEYQYNEGPVAFPDCLNKPSRTIVTGEGGSTPSRFKHVVYQNGKYRRLTPTELEQLCMFPIGHTEHPIASDTKRAFFMGNALVVGVINRLGRALLSKLYES